MAGTRTSADRQREHRQRQREGKAVYPVTISDDVMWALVASAKLKDNDLTDKAKVADTLGDVLREWVSRVALQINRNA